MALLGAALVLMAWQSQDQAARAKAYREAQAKEEAQHAAEVAKTTAQTAPVAVTTPKKNGEKSAEIKASPTLTVKPVENLATEKLFTLENELLKITFTSRGGAIRSVAMKDYPKTQGQPEPYVITAPDAMPFFALSLGGVNESADLQNYSLVSQSTTEIRLARTIAPGVTLERHYTLTQPEKGKRNAQGYVLEQMLHWKNSTTSDLQLPAFAMNIGIPTPEPSDEQNLFLNFGYYNGKDSKFIGLTHFHAGGFLFWSKPAEASFQQTDTAQWAAVKSKFFTFITTPKSGAQGVYAAPVFVGENNTHQSISGSLSFAGPIVKSGSETIGEMSTYLGPKEYARLAALGNHQDEVMQWGWPIFSFFSKLFISMLNWLGGVTKSYGVAIILLTLIIRAVMWPFTAAAAKASKKMAAVQPMLKEAQEKYKNNPEKLQKETLRIIQDNQVNPLAGCLPALLQIPVFIGFFYMLRSAAELRFESFLWIRDLSMPDTVAHWGTFPINPLPVVMLITMYYQIKLTPSSGDPQQQKVMQFTPFLFSFLLYNFSAGLTLYWTLSNLLSIVQQLMVNNEATPPTDGKGRGDNVIELKNVSVKTK